MAVAEARDLAEREHVTPFLYRRPDRFRLANLASGDDAGDEWWTVDTPDDLERLRGIVAALDDPLTLGWREVLDAVGRQAPRPAGAIHLRPATPADAALVPDGPAVSPPGSSPWRRVWLAEREGAVVGHAAVSRSDRGSERSVTAPGPVRAAVDEALDRLLVGDQQAG